MSETDAVRPTGETGDGCTCGYSVVGAGPNRIGARMKRVDLADCPVHGLEASMKRAASPLPDFPAGAVIHDVSPPTPGSPPGFFTPQGRETIAKRFVPRGDDYDYRVGVTTDAIQEAERVILTRVNAAARPAAAGLTLTDEEREKIDRIITCLPIALDNPDALEDVKWAFGRLLSSRATGAEVEIVIPEPIDDEITAFAMSSETGYGNMSHWFNHRWFRAGIEYARRHATIRGGGE